MQMGISKFKLYEFIKLTPFFRYREYELKDRLSVIFLLTGFICSGIAFILTLIFQMPFWMNSFNLTCMLICLLLPMILYDRLFQSTIFVLLFVAVIYFPFMFFTNAGNYGSAPIYFVMIMVYFAFYLKGIWFFITFSVLLTYYIIIMIYGYIHPELVIPYPDAMSGLIDLCASVIAVSIVMSIIAGTTFSSYNKERDHVISLMDELEYKNKELELLAIKDQLTDVFNRRHFSKVLEEELMLAEQEQKSFYLLMIDIDYFKKINDTYGHLYGDEILKLVANCIKDSIRNHDVLARFGGEEFIVLLSKAENADGYQLAERIREKVSQIEYRNERQVTVSIGITKYMKGDRTVDIIKRADDLLYAAKENGRNRVESNL